MWFESVEIPYFAFSKGRICPAVLNGSLGRRTIMLRLRE